MFKKVGLSAALIVASAFVYLQVRHHEFVNFDDRETIVKNRAMDHALTREGLIAAFTDGYPLNWIPVTSLSLQLDRRVFGRSPTGTLLINAALHALTSVVL